MNTLKWIACLLLAGFFSFPALGQEEKCATQVISSNALQDPAIRARRNAMVQAANNWIANHPESTSQTVVIIPTVFHIFHNDGPENISKAQILDQVRILNEDFRRLNADTASTPAPFKTVAADCQIEFRMAQLDPDGNCTDGIVRIKTGKTVEATDDIKDLSSWDNDRYLNVWVVKSIFNFTGSAGTILGYAYYPGTAPFGYDGYVVRADYVGSIDYAAGQVGRTATHEIGHYLDLVHIWGDSNCGDDQVSDTPPSQAPNFGCKSFPRNTPGCNTTPNGEMFMNYMDYADDVCMNIFTQGQKQRMNAAIASYRSLLVSPANHSVTGIFNTPVACTMVSDFRCVRRVVCPGDSVQFIDQSWNGNAASRQWNFNGGVSANNTDSIIWATFNTPGEYTISLTVSNAAGTNTKTETNLIIVKPPVAQVTGLYAENFDNNFNLVTAGYNQYGGNTPFALTSSASVSGSNSLLRPAATTLEDSIQLLVLPSLDFSNYTSMNLQFKMATALLNSASPASLKVEVSLDCGKTWLARAQYKGAVLTSNIGNVPFVPAPGDWQQKVVNIVNTSGNPNALIRFVLVADELNNFYLEDINLNGVLTGLEKVEAVSSLKIYPNPSSGNFTLEMPDLNSNVLVRIFDATGRVLLQKEIVEKLTPFNLSVSDGLYYVEYANRYYKISIH